jgi:hypothetical protein
MTALGTKRKKHSNNNKTHKNRWIEHVKVYAKHHDIPYGMALKRARKAYLSGGFGLGLRLYLNPNPPGAYTNLKNYATSLVTTGYSVNAQNILNRLGDVPIEYLVIEKAPVSGFLTGALNALSFGQFKKNLDNLGYDKLFHLALYAHLQNGSIVKMEKTTGPAFTLSSELNGNRIEHMQLQNPPITMNELTKNALNMEGRDNYFIYSAKDRNCQRFVSALLRASNLMTPEANAFINQNSQAMFSGLSGLRRVANTVTDIGNVAEKALGGRRRYIY